MFFFYYLFLNFNSKWREIESNSLGINSRRKEKLSLKKEKKTHIRKNNIDKRRTNGFVLIFDGFVWLPYFKQVKWK